MPLQHIVAYYRATSAGETLAGGYITMRAYRQIWHLERGKRLRPQ